MQTALFFLFLSLPCLAQTSNATDPTATLNKGRDFRRDHTTRYGDPSESREKALDFDLDAAFILADTLAALGQDSKQPTFIRAEGYLLAAAVRGSIAARVRSNGGGTQGSKARNYIYWVYNSGQLTREASIAYGEMMVALATEGRVARFFAANAIGIDITKESKIALEWMDKQGATNEKSYLKLKEIYSWEPKL